MSELLRLLVQAEPRRTRLLVGKVGALTAWTLLAAALATAVSVSASPLLARASDVATDAWSDPVAGTLQAFVDLLASLLVWGVMGLVLAVLTRSAAVAVSAGVAYVLVVETLVGLVAEDTAQWLPGATLRSLAAGGDTLLDYPSALALGATYAAVRLAVAAVVLVKRDVSD